VNLLSLHTYTQTDRHTEHNPCTNRPHCSLTNTNKHAKLWQCNQFNYDNMYRPDDRRDMLCVSRCWSRDLDVWLSNHASTRNSHVVRETPKYIKSHTVIIKFQKIWVWYPGPLGVLSPDVRKGKGRKLGETEVGRTGLSSLTKCWVTWRSALHQQRCRAVPAGRS